MTETAADRRLHPAALFIRFVRKAPEFVLGLPALIGLTSDAGMRRLLLLAVIGAAISFTASLLAWLRFRYGVGERDIVIESGVFNRQRRIIPFDRVQDIDIEQGLLARLFGTAKVRIETGAGGKNEGDLEAVALAEAHRLRDVIRRGASGNDAAASDEPAREPTEPLLFELKVQRLLVAGLFNFSFFYLAIIGGMFQYLRPFLERSSIDPERWIAPPRDVATAAGLAAGIYVTLAVLALLFLLGVVTGVLRTIARDYRFRLSRTHTGFRRRRGLFTLSEAVIPLRRVQLAILGSGWLRRRFGWFSLDFQTLGANGQQSGYQPAAPFARIGEIMPILAEAGLAGLPPSERYARVSKLALPRGWLTSLAPLALVAAIAALFRAEALLAFIPIALLAGLSVLRWRRHRFALEEGALYIAEGLFEHRLWILPFEKIQTISVTRTPLQRKLGLASLAVDTAGASVFRYPLIRDLEAPAAEALSRRLLEEHGAERRRARVCSPVQVIDAVDQRAADPALDEEQEGHAAQRP